MSTTIYGIWDGDTSLYFPTKAEAMREGRLWASKMTDRYEVEVTANVVAELPKREIYCRLLGGGWCSYSKVIASLKGRLPMDEDA